PGLTVSDYEVASSEEEVSVSTETDEAAPDATRLMEREYVAEEPVSAEELAAADVVPEHSEAQDEQPTQVLRAQDMGPLAGEPGADEAPAGEPEVEPSTVQDETRQVDEPPVSEPEAAGEVEREEPALAEETSSQEFFDRDEEEQADSRIFRASRFLRRRE
ncbi:MAG TPA: hypothetical protein VF206_07445, partial [Rubrobacter sp.]